MIPETLPLGLHADGHADVYDLFWKFAAERQRIFFRRLEGEPAPWTNDPILRQYRFTNVYRATDRVSQYLIRNVIYTGSHNEDEVAFRILLFKFFNKVETWQLLLSRLGDIAYRNYKRRHYLAILDDAVKRGVSLYSGAYIMAPPSRPYEGLRKHEAHLRLIEAMMKDGLPNRLQKTSSLEQCFKTLAAYPMIGEFLGFQLAIDFNYSDLINFDEMDFVVAGPGAKSGIKKCFGDINGGRFEKVIREVAGNQEWEFERRGIQFPSLWGRRLQLVDVQNVFCEIDKYSRVAMPHVTGIGERTRIKRRYADPRDLEPCWFPPKWKLIANVGNMKVSSNTKLGGLSKGVSGERAIDWDAMQRRQLVHDEACHVDIVTLPIKQKLTHFVLHYAKCVGKLIAALNEPPAQRKCVGVLVDTFIITLAAANALGVRLASRMSDTPRGLGQGSGLQESINKMAMIGGRMAKACEAMDHLEQMDFRGELERGVIAMASMLLETSDIELAAEASNRWLEIEARSERLRFKA